MGKVYKLISKFADALAELLFPSHTVCMLCGREARVDEDMMCDRCALMLSESAAYNDILEKSEHIDDMRIFVSYRKSMHHAITAMKYNSATYMPQYLAGFMKPDDNWQVDIITCVPLHRRKERMRGYNQTALMAMEVARREKIPFEPQALKKIRYTRSQAKLNRSERLISPYGSYSADENICKGKSILLIDDVCTTGATVEECARMLKGSGAEKVYVMALAHG